MMAGNPDASAQRPTTHVVRTASGRRDGSLARYSLGHHPRGSALPYSVLTAYESVLGKFYSCLSIILYGLVAREAV